MLHLIWLLPFESAAAVTTQRLKIIKPASKNINILRCIPIPPLND
jgi:hypothetical protein